MSEDEAAQTHPPSLWEQDQQNVVHRVVALPLVKATCTAVSDAYSAAKDRHPLLGSACRLAEHCVCSLTTSALDHAQPLLSHLQPQLATVNDLACRGLDKLEEKLPFLQQPSEMVWHRSWGSAGGGSVREEGCLPQTQPEPLCQLDSRTKSGFGQCKKHHTDENTQHPAWLMRLR
uniref:Perilipin-5 n=1 Tax=Myotis myotis TaxID=51298 RepID=A0A7J7XJN2_MYOMY|nr:hypothetical protein mMyoMyo1_015369 [Myotis myotis]